MRKGYKKMIYTFKLNWWNECDKKEEVVQGFIEAGSYSEVMEKLIGNFGDDEIVGISDLTPFCPENMIVFKDESLFNIVKNELGKDVMW